MNKETVEDLFLSNGVIINNIFYPKKLFSSGSIRVILTTKCNYECVYCYGEGEVNKNYRCLSFTDLISILDVAKEFGISNIKLTGGEPLCYPHIEDLLIYLGGSFPYYDITTNASLLNSKVIELFNQYKLNSLNLSLNSLEETRYNALSNRHFFENARKNIEFAISNFSGKIRINSIVFDDTNELLDYYNIIKFCYDNKIRLRLIEPTIVNNMPITNGKSNFNLLIERLREKANHFALSDGGSVEYFFFGKNYITALHSLCDNQLCATCAKYMYLRLTSDMKLKPCLSRRDNEVPIDTSSKNTIRAAFMQVINNWLNLLQK